MGIAIRLDRPEGRQPNDPEPSWSYLGFAAFRRRLAADAGFDLDTMSGFKPRDADADWVGRDWSEVDTGLEPLLNHSDCDGELTPEQAAVLAPALDAALDRFDPGDWVQSYDLEHGRELVQLLRIAAAQQITVQFR